MDTKQFTQLFKQSDVPIDDNAVPKTGNVFRDAMSLMNNTKIDSSSFANGNKPFAGSAIQPGTPVGNIVQKTTKPLTKEDISNTYESLYNSFTNVLESSPLTKTIANIDAGQSVSSAIEKGYSNYPEQVALSTEKNTKLKELVSSGVPLQEAQKQVGAGRDIGIQTALSPDVAQNAVLGFMSEIKPLTTLAPQLAGMSDKVAIKTLIKEKIPTILEEDADILASKLVPANNESKVIKVLDDYGKSIEQQGAKGMVQQSEKTRAFIDSVKAKMPNLSEKVSGQYIPRDTDELSIKAMNQIKDNINMAETIARTGTDDTAVATASQLINHYSTLAEQATEPAIKEALNQKAADMANIIAPKLTEMGRSIQAASILGRLTPEGQLRFAASEIAKYNEVVAKTKGGLFGLKKAIPELTGEEAGQILDEMKRIGAMADGPEKAMAFKAFQDKMLERIPSPLYKKVIAVWKAGLLTGLKTTGLNTMANLFHGVSEIAKDVPAVAIDNLASLFTGKRTMALTGKGILSGTKEGFERGWQFLKTGYDERDLLTKLDYKKVNFGTGKIAKGLQRYEETVFKLMGAEDQPFYYGAKAHSMYSQAIAEAKNQGLKGIERTKFIENALKNPTDKMLQTAVNDAQIAVFQNQTALGNAARSIQNVKGGEIVVPFGRTPAAVATQLVNYSPVGLVKTLVENIGKGKFDQRLFVQGMSRGVIGTAAMFGGAELFRKGLINLEYPKTEREQKLWEAEGRKPNTFKFGNKWINANSFGPLGLTIILGGYFQRALEQTGSKLSALTQATIGMGTALSEQTFLQGLQTVVDAFNDPNNKAEAYVARTLASFIPTLVSDTAQAIDPYQRRNESFFDYTTSRIPFARQSMEPKVSIEGKGVKRMGNWIETMIAPWRPSNITTDPVLSELRRMQDKGYNVSPTQVGNKEGYGSLSPEENTALWLRIGKLLTPKLNGLFATQEYKDLSDEDKAKIINTFSDKANIYGRVMMMGDILQGLTGDELKNKLKELKDSKFMTRDVYSAWQETL
jgi:hypothetical protein